MDMGKLVAIPAGRRSKWAVIGAWLLLAFFAVSLAGKMGDVQRDSPVDFLPASAESTKVIELEDELPGTATTTVLVVYERGSGITDADRAAAGKHYESVTRAYPEDAGGGGEGEGGEERPEGSDGPPLMESADGKALLFPVDVDLTETEEAEAVVDIRDKVADAPAGLTVKVTGPAALNADLDEVFDGIDSKLLLATVGVVALLLILTYRSPTLWLVPLIAVSSGAVLAMAAVYLLANDFGLTVSTQSGSIMTVLIFGAGTDYALLLVSRYREELRRYADPHDAMAAALRGSGPAILASAGTVVGGLLCLLAADLNSNRGLGPVGAVGILASLLAMLTLFPAILTVLGRKVFWPFVPEVGALGSETRGVWSRVGQFVSRRTVAAGGGVLVLLGVLSLGLIGISPNLAEEDSFTSKPDSVAGFQLLGEHYPEQAGQPLTVMARADRVDEVLEAARETPGIVRAEAARAGAEWASVEAFPRDRAQTAGERATIERLRDRLHRVEGADALVGGASAEKMDEANTTADDRVVVIPLVLVVVGLILGVLLRSVVAPLLLMGTVLLTYLAALGTTNVVFKAFGVDEVDPNLPLTTFVFLVALGVDYSIFLAHRVREEATRVGTRLGLLSALSATGGVIASAGVVLAATFGVLAAMPSVPMVQIGFSVAFGVLLATFVVQPVLVAAAMTLLDHRTWWPDRSFAAGAGQPLPDPPGGPGVHDPAVPVPDGPARSSGEVDSVPKG
ncbi:MMPL family transporter [Streptomyces sp. NPDC057362]|uniref:MMPL family transporter n=1 Tax=unclassified Streptomyces TaxID=2593676 RepID=UPI00363F7184